MPLARHFVVTLLTWVCVAASAQVKGPDRDLLIASTSISCYQTQRAMSANNAADSALLRQYCSCFAIYVANSMSKDLMNSIARGEQPLPAATAALGARYCRVNYSKY